ncbi:Uncharacterised protein [Serratia liquefaciens]|nr:hypothetical protein SFB10_3896 [Serratia liquefaciens]CAI0953084.1 Uncharacterised protein [Serratia liquefaciens]CAI1101189.1 Uncharacterised protein [Serratia liquefaciens]CAI1175038.1 Uncharacterised protein [Serratia liquefaciens]
MQLVNKHNKMRCSAQRGAAEKNKGATCAPLGVTYAEKIR